MPSWLMLPPPIGKNTQAAQLGERREVEVASAYMTDEDTALGFLYSGWCQAALSHRCRLSLLDSAVAVQVLWAKQPASNAHLFADKGGQTMDDIKAAAAGHHEGAAVQFDIAAKMHRDAAKQCLNGNFEKAQELATSAAEAESLGNRAAMSGLDLYRHHAEEVAEHKDELAAEAAARLAKHAAKVGAE